MYSPEDAQKQFEKDSLILINSLCRLIDGRLTNDIPNLLMGDKLSISVKEITKHAFEDDPYSKCQFEEKREFVIENIKESYEKKGWTVLYGTVGKCDIKNKK